MPGSKGHSLPLLQQCPFNRLHRFSEKNEGRFETGLDEEMERITQSVANETATPCAPAD
jgi:hypothetical protein